MSNLICFSCSKEIPIIGVIGRRDECPHCRADVHCCRNCHHYDAKSYNECREPVAEVVKEKNRANFCDQFTVRIGGVSTGTSREQLMSAAEALFKKK